MEKLYTSKTFPKMAGVKMHTPHTTPLDLPLAINCRNYQKRLAYFSIPSTIRLLCFNYTFYGDFKPSRCYF